MWKVQCELMSMWVESFFRKLLHICLPTVQILLEVYTFSWEGLTYLKYSLFLGICSSFTTSTTYPIQIRFKRTCQRKHVLTEILLHSNRSEWWLLCHLEMLEKKRNSVPHFFPLFFVEGRIYAFCQHFCFHRILLVIDVSRKKQNPTPSLSLFL